MAYKPMRLISLDSPNRISDVKDQLKQRLNSETTYLFPFSVSDSPAFVVLHHDVVDLIASIYKNNGQLLRLIDKLPYVALNEYTRRTLIDEIGLTNELENIHSTRREITDSLESVENQQHSRSTIRFIGMAEKYHRLRIGERIPLQSCSDIRDLYNDLVLDEVLKEDPENAPDGVYFRSGPVSVHNHRDIAIHTGITPEANIINMMDATLSMLHDPQYHILVRIAVFHYMFAYIHPFYDGNGRMARFISSYSLTHELGVLTGIRLSYVIKEEKKKYYRYFKETNESRNYGDITAFVIGFLEFIDKAIVDTTVELQNCQRELEAVQNLLSNQIFDKHADTLYMLAQNALYSEQGLDITDLTRYSSKSRSTVEKTLDFCREQMKALIIAKDGRKNLYSLNLEHFLQFCERFL